MGVHDLNLKSRICDPFGFERPGVTHERGQDAVCASDGVRAMEDLRPHHRAPPWRCWRADLGLCRSVSRHGLCTIDVARVAARYRGLPGSQSRQAVSHGAGERVGALDAVGAFFLPAYACGLSGPIGQRLASWWPMGRTHFSADRLALRQWAHCIHRRISPPCCSTLQNPNSCWWISRKS